MSRSPAEPVAGDDAHIERARRALKAGAIDQALDACRAALERHPSSRDALALFGLAELAQRHIDEALSWFWRAVAVDPGFAAVHESIGGACLAARRVELAAQAYRAAIALNPRRAKAQAGLGVALGELGRDDDAALALEAASALDADNWVYHHSHGIALQRAGKHEAAVAALSTASRLKPQNAQVRSDLGAVLHGLRRDDQALAPLRSACALKPDLLTALLGLGEVLTSLGRLREAEEVLGNACDLSRGDAELHFRLGLLLMNQQKNRRAAEVLRTATRLQPRNGRYHQTLAQACLADGNLEDALQSWLQALRHNPEIIRRKRSFYFAQYLTDAIKARLGRIRAFEAAIAAMEIVGAQSDALDLQRRRPETHAFLAKLRVEAPDDALDAGVAALLDGRPVDALRAMMPPLLAGAQVPAKYRQVLPCGADAGHSAWQLLNPFYFLWKNAVVTPGDTAQELWQTNPVFNEERPAEQAETAYRAAQAIETPALDLLRDFVAQRDPSRLRVLDLGCGHGTLLKFLASECGLPLQNLYGCDFHHGRVESARALLGLTFDPSGRSADVAATLKTNIFRADLLEWSPDEFVARHGMVDLVTMFVVAGCFDDAQLDRCLERVARLGAKHLLETSVVDTWDLWVGRDDLSPHLRRHGYTRISHVLPGATPTMDLADSLVLPRKYWPAQQIALYRRV